MNQTSQLSPYHSTLRRLEELPPLSPRPAPPSPASPLALEAEARSATFHDPEARFNSDCQTSSLIVVREKVDELDRQRIALSTTVNALQRRRSLLETEIAALEETAAALQLSEPHSQAVHSPQVQEPAVFLQGPRFIGAQWAVSGSQSLASLVQSLTARRGSINTAFNTNLEPVLELAESLLSLEREMPFTAEWISRRENEVRVLQILFRRLWSGYGPLQVNSNEWSTVAELRTQTELLQSHLTEALREGCDGEPIVPVHGEAYDSSRHEIIATIPTSSSDYHNRVRETQAPGLLVAGVIIQRARIVCYGQSAA